MVLRTNKQSLRGGFSLAELLLSIVLLALLAGAMVFNFNRLGSGAQLDEGSLQVEGLFRFARAYAASSGQRVQLTFSPEFATPAASSEESGTTNALPIALLAETDPVHNPGHFEPVPQAGNYVAEASKYVSVSKVRLIDETAPAQSSATNAVETVTSDATQPSWPAISFFPDGSSDSAEVVLNSREEDDSRQVALQLSGTIGAIGRKYVAKNNSQDAADGALDED